VPRTSACYNCHYASWQYPPLQRSLESRGGNRTAGTTFEDHWRKLNAIVRFALETGMEVKKDNSEMEVFSRWSKLKSTYEA
jgi:hypothetical protein